MFGYEEINLHLIYSSLYFILAIILIGVYAFYVYRYTIPQVSRFKKIILVTLRTLALIAILFIFFEPILSFTKKITLEPVNLVFIDNSKSNKIDDGTDRINTVTKISSDIFSNPISSTDEVYLFGNSVRAINEDSLDMLDFDDAVTNLSQVFSSIKKEEKNYSSITLISDGIVTAGSNSIYAAKNLGLPVFTIGIGDTTKRKSIISQSTTAPFVLPSRRWARPGRPRAALRCRTGRDRPVRRDLRLPGSHYRLPGVRRVR